MPLAEEKALEILAELIKKPESKAEDVPRIWKEILEVYNRSYAPPVEAPAKKRRRRQTNPNIGWPAGVSRADYNAWKQAQEAAGVTEKVNPQEYKRLRDAGEVSATSESNAVVKTDKPKSSKQKSVASASKVPTAATANGKGTKKAKSSTK